MQSSHNGSWGCYSVVNSVNNKASLKAFQSPHNNFGFGLGETLAAIIHVSTLLGRLAVDECQWSTLVLFLRCLSCLFGLSGWSSRINQQAIMDIFSLWHKEPQVSFTHGLFTQMDEQRSHLLQHRNSRISAQFKNAPRSRQSLASPTVAKARIKFWIIAEVWPSAIFLLKHW